MSFFSQIESRARAINSLLCVGLDPHLEDLSAHTGEAARDFCLRLIEATVDLALMFKPNAAFFEALGPNGWTALQGVVEEIPDEIPVLLDAKRGDIASTARAYARSTFDILGVDAVTLNPYLGYDAIAPFIQDQNKGVFLLCKTSNPGAADLQDLQVYAEGEKQPSKLYERVAGLAQKWNTQSNIGLVVGATQVEALARVRVAAPDLWFLAPGVGAQGADLEAALQAGLRRDGLGMVIPVSRGIARAPHPRGAAQALNTAIIEARESVGIRERKISLQKSKMERSQLVDALLDTGCVRFGEFTLKSGLQSPIYIDLRRLIANPRTLHQVAAAYVPVLNHIEFDHLAAIPYAALPIATAISLRENWSMIYPRKESKAYGTKAEVEGVFHTGDLAVVIDDLVTTGGSKLDGIEKLTNAGLCVTDVVVLIDRQSGGADLLSEHGYRLHAVFDLPYLLDHWESTGKVSKEHIFATREFLSS